VLNFYFFLFIIYKVVHVY